MSWIDRFANLWRGRELSRGLDEEFSFHLEARTRDNLASGMAADEAGRDARRRFGNRTLALESAREADIIASIENLWQDLRYAFRSLRKSPGFAAVAIAALGLGIGANTAVFTIVNGVLLRPLPFPESDRLMMISLLPQPHPVQLRPGLADAHFLQFRKSQQSFERIATYGVYPVTLTEAGDPVRLAAAKITLDLLPIIRATPAIGRPFSAGDDQDGRDHVVLLSHRLWRERFAGDRAAIGKAIHVDGLTYVIIGVMPAGFDFPEKADLWLPLRVETNPHLSYLRPVVGRLLPGVTEQRAQAEIDAFARQLPKERGDPLLPRIFPLKDLLVGPIRGPLFVFAGAVAFVLLIACANVANLLLMRAVSRQPEIALRAALGAGRWRLIRQLLTENALVSLAAAIAGISLAYIAVPLLLSLAPAGRIPRLEEIRIDRWVLAFTLALSLFTGLLFGLGPAFHAARLTLRQTLVQGGRTIAGTRQRLRGALVIAEIALALILLTGAGLMVKSFLHMRAIDPGFRPANILAMTVDLPQATYRTAGAINEFHQRALEKLAALPGVTAAAAVNFLPLDPPMIRGDFVLEGGRKLPPGYTVDKPVVSAGYFRLMGIRLLAGREFTSADRAGAPGVVIVSASVARLWPGEDPIGKRISMEDKPKPEDWLTIVGVVDDIRQQNLTERPRPAVYLPYLQRQNPFFIAHMTFTVRAASNSEALIPALREMLRETDRNQPIQAISTMDRKLAAVTAEPLFQMRLLATFSIFALLLAAIGVYGVLAYGVAERSREIGIRIALGAAKANVLRLVLIRTMALASAGVALGAVGALSLTKVLAKSLFEVKPTDPATFAAVAILLAGVALLAGLIPALRASRVDPLITLRES